MRRKKRNLVFCGYHHPRTRIPARMRFSHTLPLSPSPPVPPFVLFNLLYLGSLVLYTCKKRNYWFPSWLVVPAQSTREMSERVEKERPKRVRERRKPTLQGLSFLPCCYSGALPSHSPHSRPLLLSTSLEIRVSTLTHITERSAEFCLLQRPIGRMFDVVLYRADEGSLASNYRNWIRHDHRFLAYSISILFLFLLSSFFIFLLLPIYSEAVIVSSQNSADPSHAEIPDFPRSINYQWDCAIYV